MKDLYINGMTTIEDVIDMIKDNVDRGDLADANDYLDQFKEYLLQPKIMVEPSKSEREEGKKPYKVEPKLAEEMSSDKHQGKVEPDDWIADARDQHLIRQNLNKATGGK